MAHDRLKPTYSFTEVCLTKGGEDINKLQWASEKRKIRCALKYFSAIGVDYRPVSGVNASWYEPWRETAALPTA